MDKSQNFNINDEKVQRVLTEFGESIMLPTDTEGEMKEVREHYCMEKTLALFDDITPSGHTPEKTKYDAYITSADTLVKIEGKYRECEHTRYPNFKLSADKAKYLIQEKGWLMANYDDGVFYVWDCGTYRPKFDPEVTFHKLYSSNFRVGQADIKVGEHMYLFEFDQAIFTGSIRKDCKYLFRQTNN